MRFFYHPVVKMTEKRYSGYLDEGTGAPHLGRAVAVILFIAFISILVLALAFPSCSPASTGDGVVEFLVFDSPDCGECLFLTGELLPRLEEKYGTRISYTYYDVSEFEDFRLMINIEESYGKADMEIPQVYIGGEALIGPEMIETRLESVVDEYMAEGGVDLPRIPEDTTANEHPEAKTPLVNVAYFYESGCRGCDAISIELDYMREYGGQIAVEKYDISRDSGLEMNEAMCERYSVSEEKRGVAPAVFVGDEYLAGEELDRNSLKEAVEGKKITGTTRPWEEAEEYLGSATDKIELRFKKYGLFTVLGAGFLDGVNPCAFTVLVFLVAYLAFIGREGKEVLYVGGAFTITVFLTYLLIGIGLFGFVRAVGVSGTAGKWITIVVASITGTFGLVAVFDFLKAKATGKAESTLGLGPGVTRRIHRVVRQHTNTGYLVLGAVLMGVIITVLELGCTGQVYLPTITFVARAGGDRARAILYLVLYCFMFILPLVVVFLLSYFGTSQERLVAFGGKHAAKLKLIGGLVLLALSALLFITL